MYLYVIVALFVVLPLLSIAVNWLVAKSQRDVVALIGKWFVFWAVGARLFTAGLRQAIQPSFTAEEIFGISDPVVLPFVQELGYANIAMGLVGLISLFASSWRQAGAFIGGVYFGIAGVRHVISAEGMTDTRMIAMVSDLGIAVVLLIYLALSARRPAKA